MVLSHRHHARCSCSGHNTRFALVEGERQYERSRPFLVRHLALDLALDLEARSVSGTATLRCERVASDEHELRLDAIGFEISAVRLEGSKGFKAAAYEYDGDCLRVQVPPRLAEFTVQITYRAVPRRGLYFLAPDEHVKDRPVQVWTQCQDEDARYWFPCHDKPHVKMTFELAVRVPSGFVVLSNGELVEKKTPDKKPWSYRFAMNEPLPSYLVTLVAGKFAIVEDRPASLADGRKIPCSYYLPPERQDDAERSFGQTPKMIELFSKLTGVPYPWSRYSQVVVSDFIFGGMENTTATTMYEHVLLDERAALDVSSNDLVAHELAHQWFGDYVTCRDWSHGWLNEGFATFLEHVEREHRLGRDEYDYGVRGDLHAYLAEANGRYQRAIVCRDYGQPIELFDRHLYEKGGQVLHMLRMELGDARFWEGVGTYLRQHAGGIVETTDLQRAFEKVSGRSFERFFDQWVFRPGHPVLKVKIAYDHGLLTVNVKQTQKTGETAVFAFLLEIELADKHGQVTRHQKHVTTAQDTLVVNVAERPLWVAFDPLQRVSASVSVEAPADMLREQLRHGTTARIRWCAAEALGRRDDPTTIAALGRTLASDSEAWMVRAEAASALGRVRGPESLEWLLKQVKARHPKVRRAVAAALGEFRSEPAAAALTELLQNDRSYLVTAEAARSLGRTRQSAGLEPLLAAVERPSWADVTRAGALDGLAELRDEKALPVLIDHTRYGHPTRGRRAAIMALARVSDQRQVRQHLELLLDDPDPYLRIDTVRALEVLGDGRCRAALRRQLERESDGRVARRLREALRDLSDGGSADRKRLSSELEAVQNELAELKARLAKLEGAHKPKSGVGHGEPEPPPSSSPKPPRSKSKGKSSSAPSRGRAPRSKLDERGNSIR